MTEPDKCPRVEWVPFEFVTDRPLFAPFLRVWPKWWATGRIPDGL